MADPLFDQISATTLADLRRDVVQDNFFVDTAFQRLMRLYGAVDQFLGGTIMQEPFQFNRVNGGAYPPGSDVEVAQVQILAATNFTPRAYKEDVPINLWQTEVLNNGPAAAVSIYDSYMTNAIQALSTDLNIDFYAHGQPASGTAVNQNRSIYTNGADEALNDGTNPGWLGNTYSTYGGQTRNGQVGVTLNSIPIWAGDANGNTGQVSYGLLFQALLNCIQMPDTGLCNKAAFAYIAQREEPKQRFTQETDARIGLTGFKILDAYIHVDKLAPSTKFGNILPAGLSQTLSIKPATFTLPNLTATQVAVSGYPSGVTPTINPGEPFFWFRLKDWKWRESASPEYSQNFTPPIRTQSNPDLIVMFLKEATTVYTPSPRDNTQIVGIGS